MESGITDGCVDCSILRRPIDVSVRSMFDYIECALSATDEVRYLLTREVDVILECRACRSLFRSLPNLIAHKRVYCKESGRKEPKQTMSKEPETVIVEPTNPDLIENKLRKRIGRNGEKGDDIDPNGKLDGIEDVTVQKEKKEESDLTVIHLEPIPGNSNAKFQNVSIIRDNGEIDAETLLSLRRQDTEENELKMFNDEEHSKLCEQTVKLHKNENYVNSGKRIDLEKKARKLAQADLKELSCKTCGMQFSGKKLLMSHITLMHCGKRTIYPCLYCESKFPQLSGVCRHLQQCHQKSRSHFETIRQAITQQSFKVNDEAPPASDDEIIASDTDDDPAVEKTNKLKKSRASRAKSPKGEKAEVKNEIGKSQKLNKGKIDGGKAEKSNSGKSVKKNPKRPLPKDNEKKEIKEMTEGQSNSELVEESESADSLYAKRRRLYANIECIVVQKGNGKAFKCPICDRIYDKRNTLRKHIWRGNCTNFKANSSTVNNDEQNEFDRVWIDIYGLTVDQIRKVEAIIDRDQNKCLKCQRCFGILSNLRHHAVRHLGIQRYKCNLCEYKAFMQATVRTHLKRAHNKHILDGHPDMHKYIEMLMGDEAVSSETSPNNRRISSRLQSAEDRRAAAAAAIAKVTTHVDPDAAKRCEPSLAGKLSLEAAKKQPTTNARAGAMVVLQDIVEEYKNVDDAFQESVDENEGKNIAVSLQTDSIVDQS